MHIATIAKHYNVGYTEFKIRRMRREIEGKENENEKEKGEEKGEEKEVGKREGGRGRK